MSGPSERKKTRQRSPAYPAIDLRTAIEKASAIYAAEKRHSAPVSVIAQHCGYDITSSAGSRSVAALKQFGLLSEEGSKEDRTARLTELALDILISESDESPARLSAIKTAALSPPIHRKIWDKYGGNLPSKQTLRAFLIRDMEFNDTQVDRFIRQLFITVNFARLDEPDTIYDEGQEDEESSSMDSPAAPSSASAWAFSPAATTTPYSDAQRVNFSAPQFVAFGTPADTIRLPVTLPTLRVAFLEVPKNLSEKEYLTLVNSLAMFKDALVVPPAAPQEPVEAEPRLPPAPEQRGD